MTTPSFRNRIPLFTVVLVLTLACCHNAGIAQTGTVVQEGDFEREGLALGTRDIPGVWVLRKHGASEATVDIVDADRVGGSRCLRYRNTGSQSHNIHVDQLVPVTRNTIYRVTSRVCGDGILEPVIAIQTKGWDTLASVSCGQTAEWRDVALLFHSFDNELIRFEWFPGAQGRLHTGVAGNSWLDDVRIVPIESPSPSLIQSFELQRPRKDDEIDLQEIAVGPIGDPRPLQRITARNGVLLFEDGSEVALWGVNMQTALSWEYRGRLKPLGVPHTADALKAISSENLDHMKLLGADVIRMHLLPADFSGPGGGIRDTIYLDVLDDLLAQCRRRGIYVYLTLMNEMNSNYLNDSFVVGHERAEWIFEPTLVDQSARYVREFLSRKNRYTGIRYADDSTIAVVEIMNEPRYPNLQDVLSDPALEGCRDAFARWASEQPDEVPDGVLYPAYRYECVSRYLNRMCATVRDTGCPAPVVWNLNWPRMINGHEDVFQAAADSNIDGISFCCYPGQSDVPNPFWANPADLSGNNYLPYLQRCYSDYSYLRWMLGKRFAGKAKMAYEFESMYNHSAYLYPAMARLFRSLGAQIAPMWQYTLSPVAEYRAGSHYLNAYCTPRKAASFHIASQVFATTPRYAPFELKAEAELVESLWATSSTRDLSVWRSPTMFMHSGSTSWNPLGVPDSPETIVGCGDSPLATYDGSGMYVLEFDGNQATLQVLPDVRYLYPTWQRRGPQLTERVCELSTDAEHLFELLLPGWTGNVSVVRVSENETIPVTLDGESTRFRVRPGTYHLTRPARLGSRTMWPVHGGMSAVPRLVR